MNTQAHTSVGMSRSTAEPQMWDATAINGGWFFFTGETKGVRNAVVICAPRTGAKMKNNERSIAAGMNRSQNSVRMRFWTSLVRALAAWAT